MNKARVSLNVQVSPRLVGVSLGILVLFFTLLFFATTSAQPTYVFLIDFTVNQDQEITLRELKPIEGEPTFEELEGDYTLKLLTKDNQVLHQQPFAVIFDFHYEFSSETFTLDKVDILKRIPYFKEAEYLSFSFKDEVIAQYSLSQEICLRARKDGFCHPFCQTRGLDPDCFHCGNTVCEPGEDQENCPGDCAPPSAKLPAKPGLISSNLTLIIGLFLILIIIVTLIGISYQRKRKNKQYSS